ncbi:DUF805 domain-containing protein [Veillonella sp. oral taxon 158]|uniref:DUF805 domain-containing protein n=1 Tax=Veillonella sp. oral taxon 158 TaxID=671228 RepID=UPI0001EB4442|nr:DUF805 domain-containing protein [Veillonella sp. oral taxon 158]EFR60008.1 hypothetical protein HMPREF9199_0307 [Veillonella sp. oral taxon 158 str. F0412]
MKQRVYEILYRELVENYANSKGRTNTADFWLTISAISFAYGLITCITGLASYIPYGYLYAVSLGGGILITLSILLCLPTIMLMARRLRDSNNDPMLIILMLVPILGWLALFYLLCKRTSPIQAQPDISNDDANTYNNEANVYNNDVNTLQKQSVSGLFIVGLLVLGWLVNSAGSAMINHNFMVEEFAYSNLEPSALTKKANRLLESETATTEARSIVRTYYENLGKEDYHGAYRQLSVREMERYGTFELWQQAVAKAQHPKVETIRLDYVSQDKEDDFTINYTGFKVTFENGQEPVLVRLYDAGKGWGIVSIEDVEED